MAEGCHTLAGAAMRRAISLPCEFLDLTLEILILARAVLSCSWLDARSIRFPVCLIFGFVLPVYAHGLSPGLVRR